jgi:hypothetical protein
VHLPGREIAARAAAELDLETIGGFEYWARDGLPVQTADGLTRPAVDPLAAPAPVDRGCRGSVASEA